MIYNMNVLLEAAPIKDMLKTKERDHGVSYGLGEAGYDIRIKQEILFSPKNNFVTSNWIQDGEKYGSFNDGNFTIASAIEEFQMPDKLVGVVHDKSTCAGKGLSVFNTVIKSVWNGFLTLELVYHGQENLRIPAGAGIAQVIFDEVSVPNSYDGKYQNQEDRPVDAIMERG